VRPLLCSKFVGHYPLGKLRSGGCKTRGGYNRVMCKQKSNGMPFV
jgi:hypothetical protein